MWSYVAQLSPKKQDKALINAARASNIKYVLSNKKTTTVESAQFRYEVFLWIRLYWHDRFWAKKMFQLQPTTGSVPMVGNNRVMQNTANMFRRGGRSVTRISLLQSERNCSRFWRGLIRNVSMEGVIKHQLKLEKSIHGIRWSHGSKYYANIAGYQRNSSLVSWSFVLHVVKDEELYVPQTMTASQQKFQLHHKQQQQSRWHHLLQMCPLILVEALQKRPGPHWRDAGAHHWMKVESQRS